MILDLQEHTTECWFEILWQSFIGSAESDVALDVLWC